MKSPVIFERGHSIYMVGAVAPMEPSVEQIEEYAFAKAIKDAKAQAPNPHIAWFGGHYVEGDNANHNGAMWTSDELAIKQLTPMFMPVTVMHDPRTAVGLIADATLKTPEGDGVERSKIETALALWSHRFPEVVEEAQHNYTQGTLMQSMECFAPDYSCSTCGMSFHKLEDGAERENWCSHLMESNPSGGYRAGDSGKTLTAVRILRNVCFTGTGLIFGSRGARGADPQAYLEAAAQEEVAEFHQETHQRSKATKRTTKKLMETVEIAQAEYQRLLKAESDLQAAEKRATEAEEAAETQRTEATESKTKAEKAEADQKTAEEAKEAAEKKLSDAEETARKATLKDERWSKLGKGFIAKLGEKTKENLQADASTLDDEKWTARLDEVAELVGVKSDEGGTTEEEASETDGVFSSEEVASTRAGQSTSAGQADSRERASVVGGLFTQVTGS